MTLSESKGRNVLTLLPTRSGVRWGMPLIALAIALTGAGCRDSVVAPEGAIPSTIELDRTTLSIGSLGEGVRVQARVLDQNGRELSGIPLIWLVEDPSVVTVEADQRILARRNGATVVQVIVDPARARVSASGYRSGRPEALLPVEVRQQVGAFEFQPGAVSLWAVGQRRQMAVEVRDPLGTPFQRAVTVVWESGDADVVEVTPEGRLVARDDGRAEVRARAENAVGTAVVQVGTRFTFSACVSSSASRLAGRGIGNGSGGGGGGGGAGAGAGCSETPLQAIMPDSVPSSGEAGLN